MTYPKPLINLPREANPFERIVFVMMAKQKGDIVYNNLHRYYRIGARKFCILLNNCTENTVNCEFH